MSIVDNFVDLEQAFHLAYNAYLDKAYTREKDHKLRVNKHLLLPNTTTLVAKHKSKVIGCVSLVCDEITGLPSSKIFDLSPFRKSYLRIVEATSLAIDPEYRSSKGALLFSIFLNLLTWQDRYHKVYKDKKK